MTMSKAIGLLVAALAVTLLTVAAQQAAPPAWPASGQPGFGPVQLQVQEHGVVLTATVSQVVADRDGHLIRIVTLSQVGKRDGADEVLSVGTANPGVNDTWPFGSGSGTWSVTVKPKQGLTWGRVNTNDDLVITAKND